MKSIIVVISVLCFSATIFSFRKAAEDFQSFLASLINIPMASNFEGFIQGLLNAIGDRKNLEDMKKCITNGDPIMQKIREGLEATRPMDKASIKKGLSISFEGMKSFNSMITNCSKGYDKLQKLFSAINNANLDKLAEKALGRIGAFFHLVMDSLEGFIKEDYLKAGIGFGNLNNFLFGTMLETEEPTAKTMEDFLKGLVKGIENKEDITNLKKCIKEDEAFIKKLTSGLEETRPMTADSITKGLKVVFAAMSDLLGEYKPCLDTFTQLKKLADYLAKADINKLLRKIQGTIGQFFHLVMNALEGFLKDDYNMAGKGVGDLMVYLFYTYLADFAEKILSIFQY